MARPDNKSRGDPGISGQEIGHAAGFEPSDPQTGHKARENANPNNLRGNWAQGLLAGMEAGNGDGMEGTLRWHGKGGSGSLQCHQMPRERNLGARRKTKLRSSANGKQGNGGWERGCARKG